MRANNPKLRLVLILGGVALVLLVWVIPLVYRFGRGFNSGSSFAAWALPVLIIALSLIAIFGLWRFASEKRHGQRLLARLHGENRAEVFGVMSSAGLKAQLTDLGADVSGWDWMVLGAISVDGDGVTLWGGRASSPKKRLTLPWAQIADIKETDVSAQLRTLRGVSLRAVSKSHVKEVVDLAPVSYQDGSFRPLGDSEYLTLTQTIRQHLGAQELGQ